MPWATIARLAAGAALLTALKQNLITSTINRRYRLRLPNQQLHLDEFDRIVRPALQADTADGTTTLNEVAAAWNKLWDEIPMETKRAWIRRLHAL